MVTAVPDFRGMVDCKSPVKRCLFGEPDHTQVRLELVKQLAMIIQHDREKYNFDFVRGLPLDGRFEWEEVDGRAQRKDTATTATTAEEVVKHSSITAKVEKKCSRPKSTQYKPKIADGQLTLTGE